MQTLVAALLWTGAALGATSVLVAIRAPRHRRLALIVAALLFLPIGIFGIMSIGAVFIVAAAACVAAAVLVRPRDQHTT